MHTCYNSLLPLPHPNSLLSTPFLSSVSDLETLWSTHGHLSKQFAKFSADAALVTGRTIAEVQAMVPEVKSECAF